jgi:UDP-N-acetylglucosamine 1-carboxyvinyltransferase
VAALAADGESKLSKICHIERGYENIESVLSGVGAKIKKE